MARASVLACCGEALLSIDSELSPAPGIGLTIGLEKLFGLAPLSDSLLGTCETASNGDARVEELEVAIELDRCSGSDGDEDEDRGARMGCLRALSTPSARAAVVLSTMTELVLLLASASTLCCSSTSTLLLLDPVEVFAVGVTSARSVLAALEVPVMRANRLLPLFSAPELTTDLLNGLTRLGRGGGEDTDSAGGEICAEEDIALSW